jgi:IS4 transposase
MGTPSLLLEDRGYEHRRFFLDMQSAGGFFIVRGNKAIRPTVRRAHDLHGRRLRHLEGKPLSWEALPSRSVDVAIEWGTGLETYRGRLVALHKRGRRNEKTFVYLHTNLERTEFSAREIGQLYRLRWQIELLFKECKSHANLHRYDAEGDGPARHRLRSIAFRTARQSVGLEALGSASSR